MKFCKDCKYADGYYNYNWIGKMFKGYSGYTCLHDAAIVKRDVVNEEIFRRDCKVMRDYGLPCG